MVAKPQVPLADIEVWLGELMGAQIDSLHALQGGYWSAAYAFEVGGEALVLRLATDAEGFRIDRLAHQRFGHIDAIPEVKDVGTAFGVGYAISQRRFGQLMETCDLRHARQAGSALSGLLQDMRGADTQPDESVIWYDPASDVSWHQYLQRNMQTRPEKASAATGELIEQIAQAFSTLLQRCPERRNLIHADLFHQNVLLSQEADRVTGIFSWKCSALGDFLYDVAWATFWGHWYVAFADEHLAEQLLQASDLSGEDLDDWQARLCCYQLHIALNHIEWYLRTDDPDWLARVTDRSRALIEQARHLQAC